MEKKELVITPEQLTLRNTILWLRHTQEALPHIIELLEHLDEPLGVKEGEGTVTEFEKWLSHQSFDIDLKYGDPLTDQVKIDAVIKDAAWAAWKAAKGGDAEEGELSRQFHEQIKKNYP